MDLKRLQYFVAVVENGTLTSAAEKLNMSQPPLTAQIHLLEQSIGCSLFERTGRRLHLTDAGRKLYDRAKILLALCEETEHELSDYSNGVRGILRIGVVSSLCGTLFLDWLYAFSQLYPTIQYEIQEANTYSLIEKLQNHLIDMAIVRTPFSAYNLEHISLGKEPMLAVGNPDLLKEYSSESLSIFSLAKKPLIIYRRWEQILRGLWAQHGITPSIFCINDTASTSLAMAQKGLGISLLPASAVLHISSPSFTRKILTEQELSSEMLVVYRSYQDLPESSKSLLTFLKNQCPISPFSL